MNIILLGFKSSGKTTLGRALAQLAGKEFIDTDREIEKRYAQKYGVDYNCRTIYRKHGSELLRVLEVDAITGLIGTTGSVIATGGGAVVHEESVRTLQQLGVCVFLDIPFPVLEERLNNVDSPLFQHKSIAAVYHSRYPLYMNAAAVRYPVEEGATADDLASRLLRRITEEEYGK